MKFFDWSEKKNKELERQRGVTFERVLVAFEEGGLLDVLEHSNPRKYPGQRLFVVLIDDHVHIIPFVEDDQRIFLKTIIPSRKYHKRYKNLYEP